MIARYSKVSMSTEYLDTARYSVSFDADHSLRSRIAFTCCEHFILQRFPISQVMKICKVQGAVTLTVNIPPVAGKKLPKFNIIKMLISPPYPRGSGGQGFN